MSELYDPGMQPERTLLAWQRTALAFGVVNAVAIRFAADAIGLVAVAVGGAGVLLSSVAFILASGRYRRIHGRLRHDARLPHAGWLVVCLSAATATLGAAALAIVVAHPW